MKVSPTWYRTSAIALGILGSSACSKPPQTIPTFSSDKTKVASDDSQVDDDDDSSQDVTTDPVDGSQDTTPALPPYAKSLGYSVSDIKIANKDGKEPFKGELVNVSLTLTNHTADDVVATLSPRLTAKEFEDYSNVHLPSQTVTVPKNSGTTVSYELKTIFADQNSGKNYALASGDYTLAFDLVSPAKETLSADELAKTFKVQPSNVVFAFVGWSQAFLKEASEHDPYPFTGTITQFMTETWTQKSAIYDSSKKTYQNFAGGFEEMMGIRMVFSPFEGYSKSKYSKEGGPERWFSMEKLGLDAPSKDCEGFTCPTNHGYDFVMVMDAEGDGGSAGIGWNGMQMGAFDGDRTKLRNQVAVIHEFGHNFGATHCDPIQGYVMCSGEKHELYTKDGSFVWLKDSIDLMKKGRSFLASLPAEAKFTRKSSNIWDPAK